MPKTVNDSENWIVLEKQGPVPFHSMFVEYLPCVIRWAGHWSIQIWKNHTKHKESFPANTVFSYTQTSLVMFKLWYKICHGILIQKYKRLNNFTCCTCFLFTLKYLFIYLFICCCSSTVVSIFPPPLSPTPPSILPSFGFVHGSFIHVSWWPFHFNLILLPSSTPLVTVCSLFQCLWLYFACLLVCFVD